MVLKRKNLETVHQLQVILVNQCIRVRPDQACVLVLELVDEKLHNYDVIVDDTPARN